MVYPIRCGIPELCRLDTASAGGGAEGYGQPPEIEAHTFLQRRAEWRYAKGIVEPRQPPRPCIGLGSAYDALPELARHQQTLCLTSPPYCNVTNYRSDNWLRLWVLGEGPSLPDWDPEQKFTDPEKYSTMLSDCFQSTLVRCSPQTVWYIRSDARQNTRQIITKYAGQFVAQPPTLRESGSLSIGYPDSPIRRWCDQAWRDRPTLYAEWQTKTRFHQKLRANLYQWWMKPTVVRSSRRCGNGRRAGGTPASESIGLAINRVARISSVSRRFWFKLRYRGPRLQLVVVRKFFDGQRYSSTFPINCSTSSIPSPTV